MADATYTLFPYYSSFSVSLSYFLFVLLFYHNIFLFILLSLQCEYFYFLSTSFYFTSSLPFIFTLLPTSFFSCFSSSSIITNTFFLENIITRYTRASAANSLAKERENGRRDARDHECANERVLEYERRKEKKRRERLVSWLSRCSFRWGIIEGELSSDYSWIRMTVLDLDKKKTPSMNDDIEARLWGGLCRILLRSLRESENNTKEPRVLIKDGATTTGLSPSKRSERKGPSLLLSANSFLFKAIIKPRRMYGSEISNVDKIAPWSDVSMRKN